MRLLPPRLISASGRVGPGAAGSPSRLSDAESSPQRASVTTNPTGAAAWALASRPRGARRWGSRRRPESAGKPLSEPTWRAELNDAELRGELDRVHPERVRLRPRDLAGIREAMDLVDEMWAPTLA